MTTAATSQPTGTAFLANFTPGENSLMMIRDIAVAAALETAKGEDGERWRGIEKVLTEW